MFCVRAKVGLKTSQMQGGKGHWAVYNTSPQSLIIMFSYSLAYQPWGLECPTSNFNL